MQSCRGEQEYETKYVFADFLFMTLFSVIPGAKLITIVRSVPSLYESSYGYFKNEVREYKNSPSLEDFYANPRAFYSQVLK